MSLRLVTGEKREKAIEEEFQGCKYYSTTTQGHLHPLSELYFEVVEWNEEPPSAPSVVISARPLDWMHKAHELTRELSDIAFGVTDGMGNVAWCQEDIRVLYHLKHPIVSEFTVVMHQDNSLKLVHQSEEFDKAMLPRVILRPGLVINLWRECLPILNVREQDCVEFVLLRMPSLIFG